MWLYSLSLNPLPMKFFCHDNILLVYCMQQAGYTGKVKIGMDVAASEFFTDDKKYDLDFKTKDEAKKNKADIKSG